MPDPEHEPIIRLHDYYFQPCDVIYKEFKKLYDEFNEKDRLPPKKLVKFQSYAQLWLSTLYVVIEGFQCKSVKDFYASQEIDDIHIRVHWSSINHKISQMDKDDERGNYLKDYRHATLHFQESMEKLTRRRDLFLRQRREGSIRWAIELHNEITMFYTRYRPMASFLYMTGRRKKKS